MLGESRRSGAGILHTLSCCYEHSRSLTCVIFYLGGLCLFFRGWPTLCCCELTFHRDVCEKFLVPVTAQ